MRKESFLRIAISITVVAIVLVSAFEFPMIPFVFASQVQTSPSATCTFNFNSTDNPLHLNKLKVDSNSSLSITDMQRRDHWGVNKSTPSNAWAILWTSVTNETFTADVQGVHVQGLNGTASRANFQLWVNSTLDSYLYVSHLSVVTTKPNATMRRISISIGHVELLTGKEVNLNGIPKGLALSFDNFHLAILYNCKTGQFAFATVGMTSGSSLASVAEIMIRSSVRL